MLTGNEIGALQTVIVAGLGWPVSVLFFAVWWRRRLTDDAQLKILAIGIALVALGVAGNRTYWSVWFYHLSWGNYEVAIYIQEHSYFLWPSTVSIIIGYCCHLYSQVRFMLPRGWPIAIGGYVSTLAITSILIMGPE